MMLLVTARTVCGNDTASVCLSVCPVLRRGCGGFAAVIPTAGDVIDSGAACSSNCEQCHVYRTLNTDSLIADYDS